ncbi:MAG TPA: alpha-glucan family phosphorylase [Spirochaetia bacterium]|nr:alpha-glucan family phosphorylase [Spirochaetia bacterium]
MNIIKLTVTPKIPERLKPLEEIARNLWISWNFEAIRLFIMLDFDAWLASNQNPIKMLGLVSQERLEVMAADDSFLAAIDTVYSKFLKYINGPKWFKGIDGEKIAYFSMEYGLDVNLPVYSGGLGMLSGDHLKTSSDLGLPLVGVGLFYRQGYFTQYLNPDGFQQELYPENDWYNLPVKICKVDGGKPAIIKVEIGKSKVAAQIWEVSVGRNSLYLLDTNLEANKPEDRIITDTLYGGDREMRIRQEILLGIGGIRALKCLGIIPAVTHMNEGHSAFLGLEKIRVLVKDEGLTFKQALEATRPTNIFTTHTPVPAGNERFSAELMAKYFKSLAEDLGLSWNDFLALGRENPKDEKEDFCLTVLAFRISCYSNGVSKLHGKVSRHMWKNIWPGLPEYEIPIKEITNGVHPRTWLAHDMGDLLDRYFGPRFADDQTYLEIWDRMTRISDEELWRTHERRRERLVAFVREKFKGQLSQRGMTDTEMVIAEDVLSPYALTICFARRFATYKRATLLLKDPDRLIRLLSDNEHPVQFIFSGKAHPHDPEGKEMIRQLIHFAKNPQIRSRIVFLENYDMTIARYLTSGSDIWLNTPRRPLEASGTSGIKAALNGSLNVSVLDGWWDEGYRPDCGWPIGKGEQYSDPNEQDDVEGKALYDLLESEIIPLFYSRGRDGLPREWIKRMKSSMKHVGKMFCSQRMLMEYTEKFYKPSLENYGRFRENGCDRAKLLSGYLERVMERWGGISMSSLQTPKDAVVEMGETLSISVKANLNGLEPNDLAVELYHGPLSSKGDIIQAERHLMTPEKMTDDNYLYTALLECKRAGRRGYTVRILPNHPDLICPFVPNLIVWA